MMQKMLELYALKTVEILLLKMQFLLDQKSSNYLLKFKLYKKDIHFIQISLNDGNSRLTI